MFNGLIPDGTDSYNELQFFASLKTILQQQSINREEFRNFDPKEGVQQVRRSSTTVDAQLQILKEKNVETCYIRKKTEMRNFKYGRTCFNNKLVSQRAKKDINFGHFYQWITSVPLIDVLKFLLKPANMS